MLGIQDEQNKVDNSESGSREQSQMPENFRRNRHVTCSNFFFFHSHTTSMSPPIKLVFKHLCFNGNLLPTDSDGAINQCEIFEQKGM